jgi:hypothetical protein
MLAETVGQFPLGTAGLIHTFDVVGPEFSVVLTGGPPKTKVPIQAWLFLTDATRPCARREVHASPNGVRTAGSAGTAGSGENLWWILGVAGGRSRVRWSGRRPGRESLCNAAARSVPLSWKTASRWRQRSDNQGRTARRSLPELAVVLVRGHVGQLGL